jgi:hypothetical protein
MVSDVSNTVEAGPWEFHGNTLWAQFLKNNQDHLKINFGTISKNELKLILA